MLYNYSNKSRTCYNKKMVKWAFKTNNNKTNFTAFTIDQLNNHNCIVIPII